MCLQRHGDEIWPSSLWKLAIYYKNCTLELDIFLLRDSIDRKKALVCCCLKNGPEETLFLFPSYVWPALDNCNCQNFSTKKLIHSCETTQVSNSHSHDYYIVPRRRRGHEFLREAIEPEMISSLTFQLFTSLSLEIRNRWVRFAVDIPEKKEGSVLNLLWMHLMFLVGQSSSRAHAHQTARFPLRVLCSACICQ